MLEGLGECFRISMLHIYKVRGCRCYDYDRVIMTEPLGRKNGNIYSSKMAEYILRGVSEMTMTCHIQVTMTKRVIVTVRPKRHDLVGTIPCFLGYHWIVANGELWVGSLMTQK